jgi:hypothetical protein
VPQAGLEGRAAPLRRAWIPRAATRRRRRTLHRRRLHRGQRRLHIDLAHRQIRVKEPASSTKQADLDENTASALSDGPERPTGPPVPFSRSAGDRAPGWAGRSRRGVGTAVPPSPSGLHRRTRGPQPSTAKGCMRRSDRNPRLTSDNVTQIGLIAATQRAFVTEVPGGSWGWLPSRRGVEGDPARRWGVRAGPGRPAGGRLVR